jgi:hypothetical protein
LEEVMKFRPWFVAGAAALGVAAAAPTVAPAPASAAQPSIATKSCGWRTHAIIRGEEKCLARGQFCATAAKRQYVRYGFRCIAGRLR